MPNNNKTRTESWTSRQAYTLAVVCLVVGLAAGWFMRGSQSLPGVSPNATANTTAAQGAGIQPSPEQLLQMADTQASPLLKQLKSQPSNAELLARIGNVYYDAQQYPKAIEYYESSMKAQPRNADVRTDLATAYWYMGNADAAIAQFNKALSYEPNKPNTLFNLGLVQWQGKMDIESAVATWQKLLDTNPNYEAKDKVKELIAQAEKHSSIKPGTSAKSLPN
jgi:tetratricopeptide (TPR) repeat protein